MAGNIFRFHELRTLSSKAKTILTTFSNPTTNTTNLPENKPTQDRRNDSLRFSRMNPGLNEHQLWLQRLQTAWNKGRGHEKSSRLIKRSFMISSDPYRTALYFLTNINSTTRHVAPASLNGAVMKCFQEWLQESGKSLEKCRISPELQSDAFEAVKNEKASGLIAAVVDVYRLGDDGAKFVDGVREMAKNGFHASACLLASLLKIEKYFRVDEFLVPLVLLGKVTNVRHYLDGCTEQREMLLKCLDDVCGLRDENEEELAERLGIRRDEMLERVEFRKVAMRFVKLYNVSVDVCPRIWHSSNDRALKFLVDRKYSGGDIGSKAWEEMVESIVKDDVHLQAKLCLLLLNHEDLTTARKYATKYNLPTLHYALDSETDVLKDENSDDEINNAITEEFHSLSLPFSAIHFVDSKREFNNMLNVLHSSDIIGCDCEWKPREESKLSLFQIACRNQIFLIDPKVIDCELFDGESDLRIDARDWKSLLSVFTNPQIKKLGFCFSFDLKSLSQCFPEYNTFHTDTKNLLDLKDLCDKLFKNCPQIFPTWSHKSRRRLTDYVRMSLGKSLDKREQLSNWDNRPLRKQQIEYAALDVYCLLELHDLLVERAKQLNIDLEFIMNNESKNGNFTAMSELKVVVDSTLFGLGNELRLMGVDVKMATTAKENAFLVCLKEDRVIILATNPREDIVRFIGAGMWCCVDVGKSEREQAIEVIEFLQRNRSKIEK